MNVPVRVFPLFIVFTLGAVFSREARAQTTVATPPVGYVQLACTGSSDTLVSVPFNQPASFVGTVASISGSTVTVSGTPGWLTNQFVYSGSGSSTYFVQFGAASTGTNPQEGADFTVVSNGTNTVTLALNGDSITNIPVGTSLSVIPYWTISEVFPASQELSVNPNGSFQKTTSLRNANTQLLVPAYNATGINLSAAAIYVFMNGAWALIGDTNPNHVAGDDPLVSNGYIIVRNANTLTTSLTTMGTVEMGKVIVPLATGSTQFQDNPVSINQPVAVSLNSSGLVSSGAFTTTTSLRTPGDQLLLFSNTTSGINKSASAIYLYYQGHWALTSDTNGITADHGSDTISPGTGFVIRKAPTVGSATAFWQSTPTY